MNRRTRRIVAVVALCTAASMALGVGGYSSVTADRSVNVAVADDGNAFLSIPGGEIRCTGGESVLLYNRFAGAVTGGTVEVDAVGGDIETRGYDDEESFTVEVGTVDPGAPITFQPRETNGSAHTLELDVDIEGEGFSVSTNASRTIACEKSDGPGTEDPEDDPDESGRLVQAREDDPNGITSHVVRYTVAPNSNTAGNSLNSVVVRYPSGSADASGVDERADVVTVGIDEDRDGSIEVDATSDVECCPPGDGVIVSGGGNTLRIELSGNHGLDGGDTLVVEYGDVENPGEGDYTVTVGVNGDVTDTGTLTIEAD
ncbi:hypothetical protein [Haloplanus halophilus]|uniref:hypothetical protein n=1 Tax=Haloplanus halophilus TaxID=2949993 RepID=UPI002040CA74|nr:hypothetical protein [Haloplanus sp. GDY1]